MNGCGHNKHADDVQPWMQEKVKKNIKVYQKVQQMWKHAGSEIIFSIKRATKF